MLSVVMLSVVMLSVIMLKQTTIKLVFFYCLSVSLAWTNTIAYF
jgi:hypothetical protein